MRQTVAPRSRFGLVLGQNATSQLTLRVSYGKKTLLDYSVGGPLAAARGRYISE